MKIRNNSSFNTQSLFFTLSLVAIISGFWLPVQIKLIVFSAALSVKVLISFLLPLLIFTLLFQAMEKLASEAPKLVLTLLIGICISNFFVTFGAQSVGRFIYHFPLELHKPLLNQPTLNPLWTIQLPTIIPNDQALLMGFVSGFLFSKLSLSVSAYVSHALHTVSTLLLKLLSYMIPIFVIGFVYKLQHEGVFLKILAQYSFILISIFITILLFIITLYFFAAQKSWQRAWQDLKNMMPAAICGFATMSGASSLPYSIASVEKNLRKPSLAKVLIPATVNIHSIGDHITTPILAFAIMKTFGVALPSIGDYGIFCAYYAITKFSGASIPAGGILIVLPLLEEHLHFNGEMLTLITSLYMLFDPFITSMNILGNGAFAKIIENLSLKKHSS